MNIVLQYQECDRLELWLRRGGIHLVGFSNCVMHHYQVDAMGSGILYVIERIDKTAPLYIQYTQINMVKNCQWKVEKFDKQVHEGIFKYRMFVFKIRW